MTERELSRAPLAIILCFEVLKRLLTCLETIVFVGAEFSSKVSEDEIGPWPQQGAGECRHEVKPTVRCSTKHSIYPQYQQLFDEYKDEDDDSLLQQRCHAQALMLHVDYVDDQDQAECMLTHQGAVADIE